MDKETGNKANRQIDIQKTASQRASRTAKNAGGQIESAGNRADRKKDDLTNKQMDELTGS